jgi:hypothetical protein
MFSTVRDRGSVEHGPQSLRRDPRFQEAQLAPDQLRHLGPPRVRPPAALLVGRVALCQHLRLEFLLFSLLRLAGLLLPPSRLMRFSHPMSRIPRLR